MAEIKIDKDLFQERLGQFYKAWKADKHTGDAVFGGASSILVLMGKSEEASMFQKNNAIHVRVYRIPASFSQYTDVLGSSGSLGTNSLRHCSYLPWKPFTLLQLQRKVRASLTNYSGASCNTVKASTWNH